jgi:hypothetical protein
MDAAIPQHCYPRSELRSRKTDNGNWALKPTTAASPCEGLEVRKAQVRLPAGTKNFVLHSYVRSSQRPAIHLSGRRTKPTTKASTSSCTLRTEEPQNCKQKNKTSTPDSRYPMNVLCWLATWPVLLPWRETLYFQRPTTSEEISYEPAGKFITSSLVTTAVVARKNPST